MRPDTVRSSILCNASPSRHARVDLVAAGILAQRYITSIVILFVNIVQCRNVLRREAKRPHKSGTTVYLQQTVRKTSVSLMIMEARAVFTTSDFKYDD